jgi:hypothetical protein
MTNTTTAKRSCRATSGNEGAPAPILYRHDDGRYGLSFGPARFAHGIPAWHRVPLDIVEPAPANNATLSPFATAYAVFGKSPWDIISVLEAASEYIEWLETLFFAVNVLSKRGNGKDRIEHLADIGIYIADAAAWNLQDSYCHMKAHIEAAEAREGTA